MTYRVWLSDAKGFDFCYIFLDISQYLTVFMKEKETLYSFLKES